MAIPKENVGQGRMQTFWFVFISSVCFFFAIDDGDIRRWYEWIGELSLSNENMIYALLSPFVSTKKNWTENASKNRNNSPKK